MKKFIVLVIFLLIAVNSYAMTAYEFTDYSDGTTTIDGTSSAMNVRASVYTGVPYTVQITDSSSSVGVIQGLIYVDSGDDGDSSSIWEDIEGGTISGDGVFSFYAPFTHIRVNLTSGTCKARILK